VKPFNATKITVHGINNVPQILLSKVERVVEVSHWGNIAITEKYNIYNTGPKIKGEFSRVEYSGYNEDAGKNAFKQTTAILPYAAWGLYYKDEVGNISTSRAYRDVHLNYNIERSQ
jgi:oligosaccharyltransferase complex subunit alpha (ribophorin I)